MIDRITSGLIGGMSAGIAMNVIDWLGYSLGLQSERLLDWAAVVILGGLPNNVNEVIFAQLGQIFFAGILGILFSSLLLKLTSGNYLRMGIRYHYVVWNICCFDCFKITCTRNSYLIHSCFPFNILLSIWFGIRTGTKLLDKPIKVK